LELSQQFDAQPKYYPNLETILNLSELQGHAWLIPAEENAWVTSYPPYGRGIQTNKEVLTTCHDSLLLIKDCQIKQLMMTFE